MLTKPSETFRREIEPVFAAYLKDPLSERLANDVARVTDHHVDWLFAYYQRTDTARLNGACGSVLAAIGSRPTLCRCRPRSDILLLAWQR
jgi:hypothetical protein